MSQITQALQGLTEYLFSENQRLDLKDKEKRVQLAAEHIANKFSELPPDANLRQIQGLQFELIEDAAALGGLQENLPLISGLYSTAIQTRELEKQERQDTALGKIIAKEFGVDGENLSGEQKLQLAQLFKSYETEYQTVDESGYGWLKRFDMHGKEIFNLKINALGTEEQFGTFKKQALFEHGLAKDLATHQFNLELQLKQPSGTEMIAPELAGMKVLKGQQGTNGEVVYEATKGGGLFTINKQGKVVAYDGELITRKGAGGSTLDLLKTIEQTSQVMGPEQLRAMNQILNSQESAKLIHTLVPEFDPGSYQVQDANKNDVVNPALLEAIKQKLSSSTTEELATTFNQIYEETDLNATSPQIEALNRLAMIGNVEGQLKKQLYDSLPDTDRDLITDVETWNTGVKNIRNVLTNPNIPEDKRFFLQDYIAKSLGLPPGGTITMKDFQQLAMEQKMDLVEMVARNSTTPLYRYQEPKLSVYPPLKPNVFPFGF